MLSEPEPEPKQNHQNADDEKDFQAKLVQENNQQPESLKKKNKKKKKKSGQIKPCMEQTEPPTIPVSKMFSNNIYPIGEIIEYNDNHSRITNEEKRYLERLENDNYNEARKAAEVHRQVRKYAQKKIKPGMTMIEISELIENGTRNLLEANGLQQGWF
jgi:methionyl aminopeptidase